MKQRCCGPFVALLVIILGAAISNVSVVRAQGVTGAAIRGTITTEDGESADGTILQLKNTATGAEFTAIAENGGYFFDNLPPGGPYVLTVESALYKPLTLSGIELRLGQRVTLDLALRLAGEVIVIEDDATNALADRGRTGAVTRVTRERISGLPLQGRNFTDLAATTPQVSGTGTMAGQNNRFNNIQIDGGANNDLFGLASSGTPGGQSNAKPLSIEAIDQFVVQVAPFDVRQSNFAGGQINAITKSGTNDYHGSLFGYFQNKSLAGYRDDPTFQGFQTLQLGGTVGGPILRDKAHFFVSTDIQQRHAAFGNRFQISGVDPAEDIARAGFDAATVNRFREILAGYGITNAGDASAPDLDNPDRNLFVKLSTSLIKNSYLDVSYNLVDAGQDELIRAPTSTTVPTRLRDAYQLSNSGYSIANTTHTGRAKLVSNWNDGRIANELLAGYSRIRDGREVPERVPLIFVKVGQLGSADSWLAAGAERFSQSNTLDQDIFQLQDNFTLALGDHRVTFGTSNELLQIRNVFLQASIGVWAFDSLEDFAAGDAIAFQRRFGATADQDAGTAEFNVFQTGWYVQDEWSLSKNLTVMPGLRLDVPFLSDANANPALLENEAFAIDTSKVPTGNLLWSPRLGFNWDVSGDSTSVLRGGVGVFTGRPPYVWVSNAYTGNGLSQIELRCDAATVPTFTTDPDAQPTACADGTTASNSITPIDYFDPNTKYPQNLRVALGADRRITDGLTFTGDLLYTRDVNAWYVNDENLVEQGTDAEGRILYGTFDPMGFRARPTRIDSMHLSQAMKVFNKNGGRVYNVTFQLQQRLGDRVDISAGYAYSNARDRMSLTGSQALSNFQFSPIDGALGDRRVRPSAFDRPHKLTLSGTAKLPYGAAVGLTYVGVSGSPYTWTVNGDVNADGLNGNDVVFVPASASDISLQDPSQYGALEEFINSNGCLRYSRGRILERGACRNPWFNLLNLRLSWMSPRVVPGKQDHRLEIQFDIFNVLNLLNNDWGLLDQAAQFETHGSQFLRAVGYDTERQRPIYTFTAPAAVEQTVYSPTQSRWRMQLGARYTF